MNQIIKCLFFIIYFLNTQAQSVLNDVAFIEEDQFYHVQIEDEYVGYIEQKTLLKKGNYEFNMPFYIAPDYMNTRLAWDIYGRNAYGVTIINSEFQPYKGIKYIVKIPLKELSKDKHINNGVLKYLPEYKYMYSSYIPMFVMTTLTLSYEKCFFDFTVLSENNLYFFIQFDYQMHLLKYNGKKWTEITCYDTEFNGIFNALQINENVYIIDNNGITYLLENDKLVRQKTKQLKNRADNVLVIDKDAQTLSYIKKSNLQQKSGRQLKALIERNRVKLPDENN